MYILVLQLIYTDGRWRVIRTDFRPFFWQSPFNYEPFVLYLEEVSSALGSASGVLVRADATMTEFFYNKTEGAFADTWIVSPEVKLRFAGEAPFAFKPGMTFSSAVLVRAGCCVALPYFCCC